MSAVEERTLLFARYLKSDTKYWIRFMQRGEGAG